MRGAISREELEAIVREGHHLREEHRRAHAGSRARRLLGKRLLDCERRFERLLEEWVAEEGVRRAWREHFYEGGPEPDEPEPRAPLVYRGRSSAGSIVELREVGPRECLVEVDGRPVKRLELGHVFAETHAPVTFVLDGLELTETFHVSPRALAALRAFVDGRRPDPPWRYAAELVADGLIDRSFALTPRGRRALVAGRAHQSSLA
ncbi:MAG TPA: hypothetical protein VNK94_05645 [Gaiellaceae bacterium]|nr:hypothetical protein [Gaiellaceae bacterium]